MWVLAIMLACGTERELEALRADQARLREENSAQAKQIAELQAEVEKMRPAYEGAASLEAAAERTFDPPRERCEALDDGFAFSGDLGALTRLELWARGARMLPVSDGGFRVLAIRRESLLSSCGVHNGDILQAINGSPLNTTADWETMAAANTAPEALRLTVRRGSSQAEVLIRKP